ncbi:gluconate 2-dehydrogenase subunit 3 family protein [Massilia sp. GCM10023247]|uniref:gluconate 2-dehydrogenase subunit 3 family protein n=1 Tax=Massilia sp. GCM10023247 TaxID=3252643 RepID=UPI003612E06E
MKPEPPRYPGYDVLAKWNSPSYDDTTRAVLARRLAALPPRRFLDEAEWALLEAVNRRLLPQPERAEPVPITPWIDAMLHEDRGEGYRHPDRPPLRQAWRLGLAALADEARCRHGQDFVALPAAAQDQVLQALAEDHGQSGQWQALRAQHFFVHLLLKTAAGIYYAHPAAWSEIGFGGPASPRGYVRLGFDGRDPWEASEAP